MPRVDRLSFVLAGVVLFAGVILVRAAQVQIVEHAKWRDAAFAQQYDKAKLLAKRGTILDGAEVPLAESEELVRVNIAPREIPPDRRKDFLKLLRTSRTLRVTAAQLRAVRDTSDPWIPLAGVHYVRDLDAIRGLRGVHLDPATRRSLSVPVSLVPVVGRVDRTGRATDGLELALDSLLTGVEGSGVMVRDRSRAQPNSPFSSIVAPTPGHDVVLTFNRALQDVVERELLAGVQRHRAIGGDVLVMNARSGAVLAAVGVRNGKVVPSATPLTEPYEPGSVIKPFVVAALLDRGQTTATTVLNTENGAWTYDGRRFEDTHKAAQMTVADIIRYSSNIGIVKLVRGALAPSDEYALLRDLGFGAPTGVPYLGESSGRLPTTDKWTKWTWAQVATGYEVMTTPLQLAQAYTALANGGEIVEPALIAEIRDAEERPVWRHSPRTVRRVMTPRTTAIVNAMLESVVDSGTAKAAGLSSYAVAGKSGTARRAMGKQGYVPGHYNSSFIALFPADQPQLVVVSRMIDATVPNNYGGATAGTVVREVLRNTLALPDILDRRILREAPRAIVPLAATRESTVTRSSDGTLAAEATRDSAAVDTVRRTPRVLPAPPTAGTFVMQWPAPAPARATTARPALIAVPDVRGLSVRDATRLLHAAGLRVALAESRGTGTTPGAGAMVRAGSVVRLPLEP